MLGACQSVQGQDGTGSWDTRFFLPGVQGEVRTIAVRGNEVFAGGEFLAADGSTATNIARWDGTNWSALGNGVNGRVHASAVRGNDLFVGGTFTQAGGLEAHRVARWDGAKWAALGAGIGDGRVMALAVDAAGVLYVGGEFTNAGGVVVANIARWDGANWSALGTGLSNDPYAAWVLAVAVRGTELFAGGFFTDAGGVAVSCIARWNGTAWSSLGSGVDDRDYLPQVTALAVKGGDLFVGGAFRTAGNASAAHIARWDGAEFWPLGTGLGRYFGDIPVTTLTVNGDDLLVGGRFVSAGEINLSNLARWNGVAWSAWGGGASNAVNALAANGAQVFVGGSFTVTNSVRPAGLALWDGAGWEVVSAGGGQGLTGPRVCTTTCFGDTVAALAATGATVYAAGGFTSAGSLGVANVARWDGTDWWPLGAGVNGFVYALCLSQGELIAGGQFSSAGGVGVMNIARWDGSGWFPLGQGIAGPVHALAQSGGQLYVGGAFSAAGGVTASNVARWDGAAWHPLGTGMNGPVHALAASGTLLYAGGKFTRAGGVHATNVACWNGVNWAPLGGGVSGVVYPTARFRPPPVSALVMDGADLVVGGDFALAGGLPATNLARWTGTSWSAVGGGVLGANNLTPPPTVQALVKSGGVLYVGGSFTRVGGLPANNLACWGGGWKAFGRGLSGGISGPAGVAGLVVRSGELLVAGHFKFAGDRPASAFSIVNFPPPLRITAMGGAVGISWPATAAGYRLEAAEAPEAPVWRPVTDPPGTNTSGEATIIQTISNRATFYRLVKD